MNTGKPDQKRIAMNADNSRERLKRQAFGHVLVEHFAKPRIVFGRATNLVKTQFGFADGLRFHQLNRTGPAFVCVENRSARTAVSIGSVDPVFQRTDPRRKIK